jgi:hypothetical protein
VEGHFCDFRNCGGFFAKRRLTAAEELKWRHVADSGRLAADVSVTQAVDQTVDRGPLVHHGPAEGACPDSIWTVHRRSGGGGDPCAIQGGRDGRRRRHRRPPAAAELAGARSKMSSRPPNRTGRTPKERGGHKDLTGELGQEKDTPEKEIRADSLRRRSRLRRGPCCARGGSKRGRGSSGRELGVPYIGPRGGRGGGSKAVGAGSGGGRHEWWWSRWCGGFGKGRRGGASACGCALNAPLGGEAKGRGRPGRRRGRRPGEEQAAAGGRGHA